MKVTVEPLAIGSLEGPRVYICVRRVGGHLDVEEMPDIVTRDDQAHRWAAKRWNVPECDVAFKAVQVVEIGTSITRGSNGLSEALSATVARQTRRR